MISSENSDSPAETLAPSLFSALPSLFQRADHNFCNRPLNLLFPDRPLLVAVLQFAFNEYLGAFLDTGDVRRFCGLAKEYAIMSLRDRLPFVIL